ncbi:hypothetical protein JHK85_025452 [Glycine max]|uniref:Ubiquitin-like protease family profile domain-containing protein n=1 Tax=Glycine soja TaxID=3848 RepID=A0A0B2P6C8_GLYSO|nr:hypothetical protein JHK87_024780 [Glycine soja]KAG5006910.1 hypothetical protein JHK85_025452 [Glycine max]KHN03149.1 hypothetical protein glysoja_038918 [Glycine soja]
MMRGLPYTSSLMQALHIFIAWPANLVKVVSHEDSHVTPKKAAKHVQRSNDVGTEDPLCQLIRTLYDIYDSFVELLWDGSDTCLNILVLQLWMMFMDEWSSTLGHGLVYGFLEPQSITMQKTDVLNVNITLKHGLRNPNESVMKTLKSSLDGHIDKVAMQWIEIKSHVQTGGYGCGYYVMYWMWNIVSGELKNDWSMCFGDGTPLDIESITTIFKKWTTHFLKVKNI